MADFRSGLLEKTPRPMPLSLLGDSLLNESWDRQEFWLARASVFFEDYWLLFLIPAVLYYPVIFGLQAYMKNRQPFRLKGLLIVWNVIMTAFSTVGFIFTAHAMVDSFFRGSMGYTVYDGVCGTWCFQYSAAAKLVFIFNVSKIFEFTDTLFVVLRKQQLIFLHYYHHLVTMLFCWYANQYAILLLNCGAYYFSLMNYGVHMTMYGYYALRAMGFRPPFDIVITVAQIVQMVGGMTVLYFMGICPQVDPLLQAYGWALYFSFFVLFCWFFANRYLFKPAKPAQSKGSAATVQSSPNKNAAAIKKRKAN